MQKAERAGKGTGRLQWKDRLLESQIRIIYIMEFYCDICA